MNPDHLIPQFLIDLFGCPGGISFFAIGGSILGSTLPLLVLVGIEMVLRRKDRHLRLPGALGYVLFVIWVIYSCWCFATLFFGWIGDCGGL